ncbi:MAG: DUF5011 domain-containing protein [Patescibacteria group bacterium]|nr:DUF5011 domain-containing protein [Patescibacteria group bacterium]
MNPLKILTALVLSLFLLGGVSALLAYAEWEDGTQSIVINDGNTVQFEVDTITFDYSVVTVKMYDSQLNEVYDFGSYTEFGQVYTVDDTIYPGAGDYEIIITGDDGFGADSYSLTLTINEFTPVNNAPVASDLSYTANEDTAIDITMSATDADNDILTYSIVVNPSNGALSGSGATRTYTPNADWFGEDFFTYKAYDGIDYSNTATVTITVNPVNDAPVLDPIEDTQVNEGADYSYQVTAADIDGDALTYSLTQNSTWLLIDSSTGLITGTAPSVTSDINYTIDVQVSDGTDSDTQTYTLTVKDDAIPPVIILSGANPQIIEVFNSYTELGATASDAVDGSVTVSIDSSNVNTSLLGSYNVIYTASDTAGNIATETRTVNVVDTTAPVISLNGLDAVDVELGTQYDELGATVTDDYYTVNVIISGSVDTSIVGEYTIYYEAVDGSGNAAQQVTRTVNVVDTTLPIITLVGDDPQTIIIDNVYVELGATANDNYDGNLTGSIVINAYAVDINTLGTYIITYNVVDSSGNSAIEVTRTVNVVELPEEEEEEKKKKKEQEVINLLEEDLEEQEYLNQFKSQPLVIDLTEAEPSDEKVPFFQKIWQSIVDFFKSLFGF